MSDSSELNHIESLLKDFPTRKKYTPQEALKTISIRYDVLSKNLYTDILPYMRRKKNLPEYFSVFTMVFHEYLCKRIFSNAGKFRRQKDPQNGKIYFGPYDYKKGISPKFEGSVPDRIENDLEDLFSILKKNDENPIYTSIKFYQMFVRIHPFYDANGRIGRMLTTIYLGIHGYYVNWKPLEEDGDSKATFISRLNRCHNSIGKPYYEKKLNSLLNFWEKFIESIDTYK